MAWECKQRDKHGERCKCQRFDVMDVYEDVKFNDEMITAYGTLLIGKEARRNKKRVFRCRRCGAEGEELKQIAIWRGLLTWITDDGWKTLSEHEAYKKGWLEGELKEIYEEENNENR